SRKSEFSEDRYMHAKAIVLPPPGGPVSLVVVSISLASWCSGWLSRTSPSWLGVRSNRIRFYFGHINRQLTDSCLVILDIFLEDAHIVKERLEVQFRPFAIRIILVLPFANESLLPGVRGRIHPRYEFASNVLQHPSQMRRNVTSHWFARYFSGSSFCSRT